MPLGAPLSKSLASFTATSHLTWQKQNIIRWWWWCGATRKVGEINKRWHRVARKRKEKRK
jgi:hypothetical protein